VKEWRIELDPQAKADLRNLNDWISEKASPAVADGYEERLLAFISRLRHFPERGDRRDDVSPSLRVIGFERRVSIAFEVTAEAVVILRILYAGRQFGSR
jgi:toxin ParE1/3/4